MADELLPCPFCGAQPIMFPYAVIYPDLWQCVITHDDGDGGHHVRVIENGDTEQEAIEAAVVAWNRRAFEFTRDDVGSAFIDGYTAACEQSHNASEETLEKVMKRYGWVRERTCHKVREWEDSPVGLGGYVLVCSRCDCILAQDGEDGPYDGPNYCSNCGAKVVRDE